MIRRGAILLFAALTMAAVPETTEKQVREIALEYLGRPYVSGGLGDPGFDCSGYVQTVYQRIGYVLPRTSKEQARFGREVSEAHLQTGDLLFYGEGGRVSHVGLYLGEGKLAHASTGRGEVVLADAATGWFEDHAMGARRVLGTEFGRSVLPKMPAAGLEHGTHNTIAPWLLRKKTPSSGGLRLLGLDETHLGLRTGAAFETGSVQGLIVPTAGLFVEDVALSLYLSLPLRPGATAPAGRFL